MIWWYWLLIALAIVLTAYSLPIVFHSASDPNPPSFFGIIPPAININATSCSGNASTTQNCTVENPFPQNATDITDKGKMISDKANNVVWDWMMKIGEFIGEKFRLLFPKSSPVLGMLVVLLIVSGVAYWKVESLTSLVRAGLIVLIGILMIFIVLAVMGLI